eukprot:11343575-Karenia_brevis.AAC.1
MPDNEAAEFFRAWRASPECPDHIRQQYLSENGRSACGGAGPTGKKAAEATGPAVAEEQAQQEYEEKIASCLAKKDYA